MKNYYTIPGLKEVDKEVRLRLVIQAVCEEYAITEDELQTKTNLRKVAEPRQICHYLLRKHSAYTLREIGEFIGGKKHDTVIHGVKKISDLIEFDRDMREIVKRISNKIGTLQRSGDIYTGKTIFDFKFLDLLQQKDYIRRI